MVACGTPFLPPPNVTFPLISLPSFPLSQISLIALRRKQRRGDLDIDVLRPIVREYLTATADEDDESGREVLDKQALVMQITAMLQFSPAEKGHVMRAVAAEAEDAAAQSLSRTGGLGPSSLLRIL